MTGMLRISNRSQNSLILGQGQGEEGRTMTHTQKSCQIMTFKAEISDVDSDSVFNNIIFLPAGSMFHMNLK